MGAQLYLYAPLISYIFHAHLSYIPIPFFHLNRLIAWELSYIFGLDDFWLQGNLWHCSSFRPHSYYFRVHILLLKLILLLLFIFCRVELGMQAGLMFAFTFGFFLRYGYINRPFRCTSSNNICTVLLALLVINTGRCKTLLSSLPSLFSEYPLLAYHLLSFYMYHSIRDGERQ